MEAKKIKIIIVDDNNVFLKAIRVFLEKEMNYEIIGELSNGKEFLEFAHINKADIVLMDIQMPEINGIMATKLWCMRNPQTKIIAITMFTDNAYLLPLIEAGFKGCVFKTNFFSNILDAINNVMAGGLYFEHEMPIK